MKLKIRPFALSDEKVQFVTGLNRRKGTEFVLEKDCFLSWGSSSGEVATGKIEVGAAVIFNSDDFVERLDEETQAVLISKPCRHLEYWISSANSNEPEINSLQKFGRFVDMSPR